MKKQLTLLCGGVLGSLGMAQQAQAASDGKTPNFVFIFMDDMGYADLSCYGETRWTTPHIDELARNGTRFTDCYSASPVSSPSRAGLLTGRYPVRMGIQGVFFPDSYTGMAQEEVTIAELLKPQGYTTACIGKWHLGHRDKFLPLQQGFDEYFGIPYSNDMSAQVYLRGNEVEEYHIDINQLTQRYTQEAISFIRRNADKPFFLYLAHSMMHVPIYVSKEFEGKSGAGIYGDAALEIDWSVGQVVQTLRELGLEENTVIVFTSDNGPWLQEGPLGGCALPLREGKATTFEGGVRVPCIAYWKGHVKPDVNHDVISLMDWFPTVGALTNAPLPDVKIDGHDLSGVLNGTGQRASNEYAYFRQDDGKVTDFRSGDWKISLPAPAIQGNFWRTSTAAHDILLFNLRDDVSEQHNLAHKYPEKAAEMLAKLKAYTENFGEVPPPLLVWGHNSNAYLQKQRQDAIEQAKAAGTTGKAATVDGFIDVQ